MNIFLTKIFRSGFSIAASGLACTLSVATDQAMAVQLKASDNTCLTANRYTATIFGHGGVTYTYTKAKAVFLACNSTDSEQQFNENAGQIWTKDGAFYMNGNAGDGFSGTNRMYWPAPAAPAFPMHEDPSGGTSLDLDAVALENTSYTPTVAGQEVLYGLAEEPDGPALNSQPAATEPPLVDIACQNWFFYPDPVPNKQKKCYTWHQDHSNEWTHVANEYDPFTFYSSAKRVVRYGASGKYHYRVVTPSPDVPISCDSWTFGGDPIYGQSKACHVFTTSLTTYIDTKQGRLEIVE